MNNLLHWLPEQDRNEYLRKLAGYIAIEFPAAFFKKAPSSMNPAWVTLLPTNHEGIVVKAGPYRWVQDFVRVLEKLEVEYRLIDISQEIS